MGHEPLATDPGDLTFSQLVFSDYERYRPGTHVGWLTVILRLPFLPGLVASILLRAQQRLFFTGHQRAAEGLRTFGNMLIGVDFGAGMRVGPGFMMAHPVGTTIGYGLVIGANVSFAGGVTAAAADYDPKDPDAEQQWAVICDGAVVGANAVLVGGVTVGENAMVGANAVVLRDVPPNAVVMGSPARQVGTREVQQ